MGEILCKMEFVDGGSLWADEILNGKYLPEIWWNIPSLNASFATHNSLLKFHVPSSYT